MPRPRKYRRICEVPEQIEFSPLSSDGLETIHLMIDEYETVRLIDYEGLTQEECAVQMMVARTTVQRMYNDARKKIAQAIVDGKRLRIEGGEYKLCSEMSGNKRCRGCRKRYRENEVKGEI